MKKCKICGKEVKEQLMITENDDGERVYICGLKCFREFNERIHT